MSVDAQRFMDLVNNLHIIWSGPLQIVLALIFLYLTMGPSIFAGLAAILILVPINACIAHISRRFQAMLMERKDRRIKLLNEVLNGIKASGVVWYLDLICSSIDLITWYDFCFCLFVQIIKLYAWEAPFIKQIMRIRQREIRVLRKSAFFNASISFNWLCAPFTVIHSLTVHSFTHLFTHSLTYSFIHSLTYSFTHSFIHLFYIF